MAKIDVELKDFDIVDEKDSIFLKQHIKAMGEENAKKMLVEAKKKFLPVDTPKKVYINVYGAEVHVNGPVAVGVARPETLKEKIARFNRLAANVKAHRQLMMGLYQDMVSDDETDEEAEKAMEEVVSVDDFGDSYVVKSQAHLNFTEPKKSTSERGDTDNVGSESIIADDESAQDSPADKPSDIVEQ